MSTLSDDLSLILTHSQEMTLLMQNDVGNILSLLGTDMQPSPQVEMQDQNYVQPQYQAHYLTENPHQNFETNLQEDYEIKNIQVEYNYENTYDNEPVVQVDNKMAIYQLPSVDQKPPPRLTSPVLLCSDDYSGPYNFEVCIDPHHGSKNPWVYSTTLNKLFIGMSMLFPIDFKCDFNADKVLFIRATPLFTNAQHSQELVTRCITHSIAADPSNRDIPENMLNHVIRCQNQNAEYLGNVDNNQHLNVLIPLGTPQAGSDIVRSMYSFVCKNSCPSGMNRKPFGVVFTLEDKVGNLLGRRKLNVRVCSCPKRDKDKEEKDFDPCNNSFSRKKRKLEKPEKRMQVEKEYQLSLTISGKQNYLSVLNAAYDRIAGELKRNGPNVALNKCLSQIQEQINNVD